MTHIVEVIDENTVRLTESVSTVTEYDVPTLKKTASATCGVDREACCGARSRNCRD